jgi:hypothetical protein
MNAAFRTVIAAGDDERRDLFLATARRLGTAVQNVEKDFWVCWTLDALFNGLAEDSPRLLFKGGTSLSKSFALIDRFSEDIDITVFRSDLGEGASVEELEAPERQETPSPTRRHPGGMPGVLPRYVAHEPSRIDCYSHDRCQNPREPVPHRVGRRRRRPANTALLVPGGDNDSRRLRTVSRED